MKKMIIVVLKILGLLFTGFLVGWKIGSEVSDEVKIELKLKAYSAGWNDRERWSRITLTDSI